MGAIQDIFTRLYTTLKFGQVKVGGTISTLSPNDAYPTHIANLGVGGHHAYDTLLELADIPTGRLQVGMSATVKQHIGADGKTVKRTKYTLEKLLPPDVDKLSDITDYDISEFWKVESISDDYSGAFETQYSPNIDKLTGAVDVNGGQPPFPGKPGGGFTVTQTQYNALAYWVSDYDPTKNHVWQRQRFADSPDSNWGIPVKISGESYEAGDYIANIFKRSVLIPDTPLQFVGGKPNNNPAGWNDIPPVGTDALWMTKAQKDTYGQIKSPWTTPILIAYNPLLVRYNETATPNPNALEYDDLDAAGWVPVFDPAMHKFLATRQEAGNGEYTLWTVIKIADESGEYIDYVYKAFALSVIDDVLDNPNTYKPTGQIPVDGWEDTPVTVDSTQRLFVSSARKFINGELITEWSDPVPFSGDDTIIDLVTSSGGDEFKWNKNVTPNTVQPAQLILTSHLYRGTTDLIPDSIAWYKIYDNGNLIEPPIELGDTPSITILPADVVGKALFLCTQTFQGMTFNYEYSILDISDGIDAKSLVLTANSQIITKKLDGSRLPAAITLRAYSSNLSDEGEFTWFKKPFGGIETQIMIGGTEPYQGGTLAVNYADFVASDEITYRVVSVDTGGGLQGLDDDYTIYQVPESANGSPAILMILSNDSHNLVQDETTGLVNFAGASTRVKILEGPTDVTSQWVIRRTNSAGITSTTTFKGGSTTDIDIDPRPGVGTFPIQVIGIGATQTAGFITITATKGATTLTKQFSLSKIVDPAGSVQLDIDSSVAGFAFSPNQQAPKELTALLYIDGNPEIQSDGKFDNLTWFLDGIEQPIISDDTILITPNMVNFNLTVRARVRYKGSYYSRTVNITDVKDAKGIGILYTTRTTDGSSEGLGNPIGDNDKPSSTYAYNVASAPNMFITWTTNSTGAKFMTIRKQDDPVWSTPIRISGEKGEQGTTGNYIKNIFQWNTSKPARPTGNPIPTGWFDSPPTVVQGSALWQVIGEVTSGTNSQLVGVWSDPVQISGTQGVQGQQGIQGVKGNDGDPALSLALQERARASILPPFGMGFNSNNGVGGLAIGADVIYTPKVSIANNTPYPKLVRLNAEVGATFTNTNGISTYELGFEINHLNDPFTIGFGFRYHSFGSNFQNHSPWRAVTIDDYYTIPPNITLEVAFRIRRVNGTGTVFFTTLQANTIGTAQVL